MFEITPKEQILKNVRKGLVQPLANPYPDLNLDNPLLEPSLLLNDEDFVKNWTQVDGFLFNPFNGEYDLLHQIRQFVLKFEIDKPTIVDTSLIELFCDNDMSYTTIENPSNTLICSVNKLESITQSLYFNSEIHPIQLFNKFKNIVFYINSSQIETPENNKIFSELGMKNLIKVQLKSDYFKSINQVILLVDENA
ncbi:MAG: hypothetical protein Q8K70_06110 [Bacteroidota bacterium]|nr:hypothetical protein [Bacteroidota bacterium]